MKILHVIESLDPALGGPSVSSPSTAAAQAADGHDVSIVCYGAENFKDYQKVLEENIPGINKVKIIPVNATSKVERIFGLAAKKLLNELVPNQDVIHLQGVWRPILLSAAKLAKCYSKRYVVSPRGMLDPWSLKQKYWKKRLGLLLGWRSALDSAHFIHALNAEEAQLMEPLRLQSNIKVYPNGAFPEKFSELPTDKVFREKYPQLNDKPYILFLSRIHYKKGLDYLIKAFGELTKSDASVQLVVAGPDEGHLDEMKALAGELKISSRVSFIGPLYGEIKYSAMVGARCFCLSSRQEGFSMAITESLACGTPVVISTHCHFEDVAKNGAGYITELDVNEIKNSLELILNLDPDGWNTMSSNARSFVLENYSWYAIAKKLVLAYES